MNAPTSGRAAQAALDGRARGYEKDLDRAAGLLDVPQVAELGRRLLEDLKHSPAVFPVGQAKGILRTIRGLRLFPLMQEVAEALIASGQDDFQVRRQRAQALIDQNRCDAAIAVLQQLIRDTGQQREENAEARGLLGRAHKQKFVVSRDSNPAAAAEALRLAAEAYYGVYQSRKADTEFLWHGINTVALLARAGRAKIALGAYPDYRTMAAKIFDTFEDLHREHKAEEWDFATAAEACVALGRPDDALHWLETYAKSPYTDAFALAGTLRQFTEIWGLKEATTAPLLGHLVAFLEAEVFRQGRGHQELVLQADVPTQLRIREEARHLNFERVFADGSLMSVTWFVTATDRSRLVARIDDDLGNPVGTGFLVRGGDLVPELGDEWILMTNAHVLSDDPDAAARQSGQKVLGEEEARVAFTLAGAGGTRRARTILWSSLPGDLDATLARLDELAPTGLEQCPLARKLPLADGSQSVWVISHPGGKSLSFSSRNNVLVGCPDTRLHYRAATEGGSSGGPVFSNEWKLIGLHHASASSADAGYNEGISILAIVKELRKPEIQAKILSRAKA